MSLTSDDERITILKIEIIDFQSWFIHYIQMCGISWKCEALSERLYYEN